MKLSRVLWLLSMLLLPLLVVGCGSSNGYTIVDRKEGAAVKAVFVQVPDQAGRPKMSAWADEIESREWVAGKKLLINFYVGRPTDENLIASHYEGRLSYSP